MTTPYPTTTLWTCPFMIPLGMYQSLRSRTAKFDPQRIRQHSVTREARAIPIGEHILVQRTSSRILPPSINPPCLPIHKIASVSFPLAPTGFTPSVFSVDFFSVDTSISYTYHFDFTFTELISEPWEVRFMWSPSSSLRVRCSSVPLQDALAALYQAHPAVLDLSPLAYLSRCLSLCRCFPGGIARRNSSEMMLKTDVK